MTDIKDILSILDNVATGHSGVSVELCKLRPALTELQREISLKDMDLASANRRIAALEARDADVTIASLEKRLGECAALKDSYAVTIDKAMGCVEAVLGAVCGTRKADVGGAGAEFFENAGPYLVAKITSHVKYVKSMTDQDTVKTAMAERDGMKVERNAAVRKQLDLEQKVRQLGDRVAWFEKTDLVEKLNKAEGRIAELTTTLAKAHTALANNERERDAMKISKIELESRVEELTNAAQYNHNEYVRKADELQATIEGLTKDLAAYRSGDTVPRVVFNNINAAFDEIAARRKNIQDYWYRSNIGQAFLPGDIRNMHNCNFDDLVIAALSTGLEWKAKLVVLEGQTDTVAEMKDVLAKIGAVFGWSSQWWLLCKRDGDKTNGVDMIKRRLDALRSSANEKVIALGEEIERLTDIIVQLRDGGPNAPR